MKNIGKVITKYIHNDLFWLLVIGFTFRNLYQSLLHGQMFYNADSATYWYAAQNILKGIIDDYRTPVYPIIMKIIGSFGTDLVFERVIFFQHIVSFISIVPFYMVCRRWFRSRYVVFFSTLLYACQPWILKYNNGLFAESLLVSSFVFYVYFFSDTITRPSTLKWLSIHLYIFYMVMLKPLCIFLYGLIIAVWFFNLLNRREDYILFPKSTYVGLGISIALLLGYCLLNNVQNNFLGISKVSHDNNFANVILSSAYKSIPDPKLVSVIDTVKAKGHYYAIYYLNNDNAKFQSSFDAFPPKYSLTRNMEEIKQIPPNKLGYTRVNLSAYIKKAMQTKTYIIHILGNFIAFGKTNILFLNGYKVYILLIIEILLIFYNLIHLKKIFWMRFLIVLTAIGIIFTTIVGGINDGTWERVLVPVVPFLLFILFDLLDEIIDFLNIKVFRSFNKFKYVEK